MTDRNYYYEEIDFARLIKTERKRRGLSLSKMAESVLVSASYISLIETGKRQTPSFVIASRIINFFGLNQNELSMYVKNQRNNS
ncbi:hypothetical protein NBRC111894_4272 [Sporolactobacillus inulinus]|uniref:HTH cro/C1-type domain-containing protein n=1 Tax=Sporolactobacillus inulinus TaxID=2078 RepID=A0A4Y1ZJT9_9BACL|nr:helix-turn-helix transcriptional regulator [Sporolactobacillus inulinus]GAY78718.1 hypothetical protein NBRC111894_4272 [Sporolactobacillus inulinus]